MRKLLSFILFALAPLCASAQSYTTITATSCIGLGDGSVLPAGTFQVQATDGNDGDIPFRSGGAFQSLRQPVSRSVVNGSLSSSLQLGTPSLASPVNILFRITITDNATKKVTVYRKVPISGTTWDFCSMDTGTLLPTIPHVDVAVGGAVASFNGRVGSVALSSSDVASVVTTQTGCNTAGNAWNPATNTCSTSSTGVSKSGDTMTGPLVLPADPTTALQASTKQYVDAHVGVSLPGSPTAVWAGGSGTSVLDTSGNGNNITIATSATASTSGITFSAAGQAVRTPVTSTYQTAMVCYTHNVWPLYITNPAADISTVAETVPTLLGTTTQTGSTWLAGMNGTQNPNNAGVANGFIQPSVVNPSGGYLATQYTAVSGGPHCTIHIRNSSSDLFYLDGFLQSNAFAGASSTLSMVGNTVLGGTIVSGTPSSSAWFGGTFHLVVLWPSQLTSAQVTQAEQYAVQSLTSRNLAAPGVAPSMLSDGVSRLTLVGNSITACAGNGPSTCWNNLLTLSNTSLNTNINRVVGAGGGTSQPFMTSGAPYREDPLNAPNASTNVALLWDGINDGCRYGDSPDQQWALDVAWAVHKRNLGFKILIGTMIDDGGPVVAPSGKCGGGLTPEAYQAAYNTLIYTQSARWFDGIADFSGDTTFGGAAHLGCSGCSLNGTYFLSDHIHPVGPSEAIIANIASSAINLLTTSAKTQVVAQSCGVSQFVSGITSSGILTCAAAASIGPPTDMIENWKSQDGSGTTLANTGSDSTNSMTTTNVTWATATGFTGLVATYNGSTSTATAATDTNTNFTGSTPFSVCQWVNPSTLSGFASNVMLADTSATTGIAVELFGTSSGTPGSYGVLLYSSLANNIQVNTSTATIPVGSATLACFTYAATGVASGVTMYINGTAVAATVGSNTLSGGSIASGLPMRIGSGGGPAFTGAIGRTQIFNRLLSASEIAAIFTAGPN